MREEIYTIPVNDAVNADDECPFCYIERMVEHKLMDFVLGNGASYMESDIRDLTDEHGFCKEHFKKMFKYQNALGNAWILSTHYNRIMKEMDKAFKDFSFTGGKAGLFSRKNSDEGLNSITKWTREREKRCYICENFSSSYERYMDTFFNLYESDSEFKRKVDGGKGFCLTHYGDVIEGASKRLKADQYKAFAERSMELMRRNMKRLYDDVDWMIQKYDYRNKDADWKTSKDAAQRAMQKLKGGYPADDDYRMKK